MKSYAKSIIKLIIILHFSASGILAQNPSGDKSIPGERTELNELEIELLIANPELVNRQFLVMQSKADIRTAELRPNPSISGMISNPVKRPSTFLQKGGGSAVFAELSFLHPVELAGRRGYRIDVSRFISRTAAYDYADLVRNTLLQFRKSYYQTLAAKELLDLASRNLEAFRKLNELNESRLSVREISLAEYTRSLIAFRQAELQKQDAELNWRKSSLTLAALLGRKEPVILKEKLKPLEREIPDKEEYLKSAYNRRPDLQAARSFELAANSNVRYQDSLKYPELSVGAQGALDPDYNYLGLVLSVGIPVYSRNQGEREKARIALVQSGKQIEILEKIIQVETETVYTEYHIRKQALAKFISSTETEGILQNAETIRDTSEFAYQAGEYSLLQLLDAIKTYIETYRSYISAISDYNQSIVQMDAVMGADHTAFKDFVE